jgi:transposase-like protein
VRKARRAAARRGRRLRIMFADEARFGRINRPRPCWAPPAARPEVASQLIREYIYLYGAVCPRDGTCFYLIMPTSDTACFQTFLDALARKHSRHDILLVVDGAPNHRGCALAIPSNISLLFLPPYSPELTRKKISGMKFEKRSSKTTPSNPSKPFVPSSRRQWSTLNATQSSSNQSRRSPISPSHTDMEAV